MKVLALDIGGTRSRFADCVASSVNDARILDSFEMATRQSHIRSFNDLLQSYEEKKSSHFANINDYDGVVVAIAGPVLGDRAVPPNIDWAIDLGQCRKLPACFLINDFAAQAQALLTSEVNDTLTDIRTTHAAKGISAVIGAGTGLGHCLLLPAGHTYRVLPSEAGQAGFSFVDDEQAVASFMRQQLQCKQLTNDHVVSGKGLQLLHQHLTGQQLDAAAILSDKAAHADTLNHFSRLYARACRNFCLTGLVTERLILSGGLAARHPELVSGAGFLEEFDNSPTHRSLLENIGVFLNRNEQLGLLGAFHYWLRCQAVP